MYLPCMCSHVCPIKSILIEHKVVAMTADDVLDVDVTVTDASHISSTQL